MVKPRHHWPSDPAKAARLEAIEARTSALVAEMDALMVEVNALAPLPPEDVSAGFIWCLMGDGKLTVVGTTREPGHEDEEGSV
jgi:hypothetical protein